MDDLNSLVSTIELLERLETLSDLDRSRFIDDKFGSYPLVYDQLRDFYSRPKIVRISLYRKLRRNWLNDES